MRFAKYHGIGNDFIMLADMDESVALTPGLVRSLCDRRFGVGADGVIRVAPGREGADLFMDYVNSDGSVGEMCGNGIRCLALFARAEGLIDSSQIKVGTRAGVKVVEVVDGNPVRVDMGPPVFLPSDIPAVWDGQDALHAKVDLQNGVVEVACLSMGNPHAVLFVEDPDVVAVGSLGRVLERHAMFPNKVNVEFAAVESSTRIRMRVWERGSGETLACGTGACAVAVAGRLLHDTEPRVAVELPGGGLEIEWDGSVGDPTPVLMTGPAVKSFEGDVDVQDRAQK